MAFRFDDSNLKFSYEMRAVVFLAIFGLFGVALGKTLPSFIKPCHKNADLKQCIMNNIEQVKPFLNKGVKALNVPPMTPLVIPLVKMEAPTFRLELRDAILKEFNHFEVKDVEMDLEKGLFKITLDVPKIIGEANYTMDGTVFLINVTGGGYAEGEVQDLEAVIKMKGSPKDVGGKRYMDFKLKHFDMSLRTASVYFRDLVPGDDEANDRVNAVINAHIKEFFAMIKPIMEQLVGGVVVNSVKTVFARYSLEELFVD